MKMKKIKFIKTYLFLAIVGVITLTSCDALLDETEIDFGNGPILAQFENTSAELNLIKDPAIPTIDFEIPITYFGGKNVVLDRDVTVTIATSPTSAAVEGVEFELLSSTFTIPAGETTALASVRILTAGLVPFDFKDIVLEITDSSESVSDVNTFALTLKALPATTLAGTYEASFGGYYREAEGGQVGDFGGRTFVISAISPGLYSHRGIAFWVSDANTFYFTVDEDTGVITVLPDDPDGTPVTLNGSPIMTCDRDTFNVVTCDNTTSVATLMPDGKHVIKLTTGYFRDISINGTREFYEELVRL